MDRLAHAIDTFQQRYPKATTLVVAGGVAANQYLRTQINEVATQHGVQAVFPPPALCTDNAAMIAWAGIERLRLGLTDGLDFAPRPRWPLDPTATPGARA
jgi:N6-L-threonylcarbamoyladenine synthase